MGLKRSYTSSEYNVQEVKNFFQVRDEGDFELYVHLKTFFMVLHTFSIILTSGENHSLFGKWRMIHVTGLKFVSKMFINFWKLISPPTNVNIPIPSLVTQPQNIAEYFPFQRTPRHLGRHTSSNLLKCKFAYSDECQP